MLTHRALLANWSSPRRSTHRRSPVRIPWLLALPLFHVYGLTRGSHGRQGRRHRGAGTASDRRGRCAAGRRAGQRGDRGAAELLAWAGAEPASARGFAGLRIALSGAAPLSASAYEQIAAAACGARGTG